VTDHRGGKVGTRTERHDDGDPPAARPWRSGSRSPVRPAVRHGPTFLRRSPACVIAGGKHRVR